MKGAEEVIKRWYRKEYSIEKKNMMKGKENDERRNSKNKIHKVKDTQTKREKKGDKKTGGREGEAGKRERARERVNRVIMTIIVQSDSYYK